MIYEGFDVLDFPPNRSGPVEERSYRTFALLDSRTGKRTSDEQAPAPAPGRPFVWTAFGKAEISLLRAFLDARMGAAVPFWLPSAQWDLELAQDFLATDTLMTIVWIRYQEQMFGTTGARRHLVLWPYGGGDLEAYQVTDATDPGDGDTETLTLSPAATRLYPAGTTVVSFLKLCRLEEDLVEISYPNPDVAEAVIQCREIPLEAPV